eukprot:scaffold565_cov358-Prasinococcus_capsulatus_cf.AAC.2
MAGVLKASVRACARTSGRAAGIGNTGDLPRRWACRICTGSSSATRQTRNRETSSCERATRTRGAGEALTSESKLDWICCAAAERTHSRAVAASPATTCGEAAAVGCVRPPPPLAGTGARTATGLCAPASGPS